MSSDPMPGYTGHVPAKVVREFAVKAGPSTRMPLDQRVKPVQGAMALTKAATPEPIRSYFLPKRHVGTTSYAEASCAYIRCSADAPPRAHEQKPLIESLAPKFTAKTCQQVCQEAVAAPPPANFFSKVRQVEKCDDDNRGGVTIAPTRSGAAHNLRNVDIMRKREQDANLAPPKTEFKFVPKRSKNGIPPPTAAESVHFTHLSPLSSNQAEYQSPSALRSLTEDRAKSSVQRALTECASTKEMFAGTPKARSDLPPGYMGHVPAHRRNLSLLHGDADDLRMYTKNSINVSHPSAGQASKQSLFAGRSKAARMQTVMGFTLEEAAEDKTERAMNTFEHNIKRGPTNN
jgi:hypothetical protein